MNTAAARIYSFDAVSAEVEAYQFNEEFDHCHALSVHHGHPLNDEPRADQFELVKFAGKIAAIKLPDLKTKEGQKLGQIVDALLRDVVDVTHEEIESF